MKMQNILIAGGTHGNELTGIFLVNHWLKNKNCFEAYPFHTELLLSNPGAAAAGQRYLDEDLNRCFVQLEGVTDNTVTREKQLAMELKEKFSGSCQPDFIIDMHTSTSNMGITLMIENLDVNLYIADYVRARIPGVNIYAFEPCDRTKGCLRSMSPHAIGVEIGPVPQNLLCHRTLEMMEATVSSILKGIESIGRDAQKIERQRPRDIYTHVKTIQFPQRILESEFFLHKDMETKNYQRLKKGDPVFVNVSGDVIVYEDEDDLCPVFVNEAAYYDKNIAFSLVRKLRLDPGQG